MKYIKPISRRLNEITLATGVCFSGASVVQECGGGGSNVGPCTVGEVAGKDCVVGLDPGNYIYCTSYGGLASGCASGNDAGID